MSTTSKHLRFTVEIELPAYTRQNLIRRSFVVGMMLLAADRYAFGHRVEQLGIGGDEVHRIHVADEVTAMRLQVANERILRASYSPELS